MYVYEQFEVSPIFLVSFVDFFSFHWFILKNMHLERRIKIFVNTYFQQTNPLRRGNHGGDQEQKRKTRGNQEVT